MKKLVLIFSSLAVLSFTACDKKESESSESATKKLKEYVDSVKALSPENNGPWASIEAGYQARLVNAEVSDKTVEEKEALEKAKQEFEEYRNKQSAEDGDVTTSDTSSTTVETVSTGSKTNKQAIRDALFGQGKLGDDIKFNWVNGQNILSVYEGFVASVKANKDNYTREDWDEVKVLYEALDTRKNEVEKDLSTKDNLQIAKRKVEFASYESIERPMSKAKENEDAKK